MSISTVFFHQVNSLKLSPKANNWPYHHPASVYASNVARKSSLNCGESRLLPSRMMAQAVDDYEFNTTDSSGFSEPTSIGMTSSQCDDSQSSTYSQSPAYPQPIYGSSNNLFEYANPTWSPKGWDSALGLSRPSHGTIYPDPETASTMAQSAFSYLIPSHSLSSSEAPLPIAGPVSESSLDFSAQDRILPTPTCRSQQISNGLPVLNFPLAELTSSSSVPLEARTTYWSARPGMSQGSCSPDSSPSSNVLFNNSVSSVSSGPETTLATMFSSLPIPTTAEEAIASTMALPTAASTSMSGSSYPTQTLEATTGGRTVLPPGTWAGQVLSTYTESSSSHESYPEESLTTQRMTEMTGNNTSSLFYSTIDKCSRIGDTRTAMTPSLNGGLGYSSVRPSHLSNPSYTVGLVGSEMPEYHHAVMEGIRRASVSPLSGQGDF
ncbi:hypothetical protein N7539_006933 [Penicillium diatomitis]|uniref:Streptococcal hemagglutinin protein n=1 Tax=Penicillium diatomitis TaxID=2819901 RepID=A0A9X0BSF4_9EURO|nr:uncharacterized protein N7539_006933 [Penicillium diatomitis]KAJ5481039.1 hypothetical protein N7539_006933 [Penicillium diatomitis]